ncbi:hypothetical protein DEO72_LG2g3808 [Vigna unguiculata]|uniref:Uncharacterized protein n=1 Tax=Vigna unguiculata TaxID=3917 RepID=A0A4D6L4W4_VIGUN|nr:hypothetical protein DEO72_LG2g3808 [Vigna unguiculata]
MGFVEKRGSSSSWASTSFDSSSSNIRGVNMDVLRENRKDPLEEVSKNNLPLNDIYEWVNLLDMLEGITNVEVLRAERFVNWMCSRVLDYEQGGSKRLDYEWEGYEIMISYLP